MNKTLIAYFSASGVTAKVAKEMAGAIGADLYEICPVNPYTNADMNWMDKKSRSTTEMNDPTCRPAIASPVQNMEQYDTVMVGFPIWWYQEPMAVDTFLESYNFDSKTIIPFCTSTSSSIEQSMTSIQNICPQATVLEGLRLQQANETEIDQWLQNINPGN